MVQSDFILQYKSLFSCYPSNNWLQCRKLVYTFIPYKQAAWSKTINKCILPCLYLTYYYTHLKDTLHTWRLWTYAFDINGFVWPGPHVGAVLSESDTLPEIIKLLLYIKPHTICKIFCEQTPWVLFSKNVIKTGLL